MKLAISISPLFQLRRLFVGLLLAVVGLSTLSATPPAPSLISPPPSSTGVAAANIKFTWVLYADPNGYQLSSYLLIKKRSQSWDAAGPGNLGATTTYTTTLEPGVDYDWAVAAVDWGQHTASWYQFSGVWSFTTTTSTTNASGPKIGFRKPVDNLRDYNGTYTGVAGTGTQAYSGGTLYRDNYTSGNFGYEGAGSHPGVDIPVSYVAVYAAAYGEIIDAGYNGDPSLGCGNSHAGWGNRIIIKTTPPWLFGTDLSGVRAPERDRVVGPSWCGN